MLESIDSGSAYMKFLELIEKQGGDVSYINDVDKFEDAKFIKPIYSEKSGYVKSIDALKLGNISCYLGAGRLVKEASIDNQVGLIINKKIGDSVEEKEIIGIIHANDIEKLLSIENEFMNCFEIVDNEVEKPNVILGIME